MQEYTLLNNALPQLYYVNKFCEESHGEDATMRDTVAGFLAEARTATVNRIFNTYDLTREQAGAVYDRAIQDVTDQNRTIDIEAFELSLHNYAQFAVALLGAKRHRTPRKPKDL